MPPLITEIVIIIALSVAIVYLGHRLRLPAIVGFLLTGVLAGPHGLGLVSAVNEVEILAEIGVILLLFVIGIEFSLVRLLRIKRVAVGGGLIQVGLTILAGWFFARLVGLPGPSGWLVGFMLALSSTAIVLRLLQERGETGSPSGQIAVGVLIFQDLAVVPMVLVLPILAGRAGGHPALDFLLVLGKAALVVGVIYLFARKLVPAVLFRVAATRSRELFLLTVLLFCSAIVFIAARLGLSLALGAFLAGLIISETEYSHEAFGSLQPFRDVFTSFFFVSIGMLLDVHILVDQALAVCGITAGLVFVKTVVAMVMVLLLGFPLRVAIISGLALAQIGEFSFLLAQTGLDDGLLSDGQYQIFLAAAILTMALTPALLALAPVSADRLLLWRPLAVWEKRRQEQMGATTAWPRYKDHLLIVGYGLNGRNLARAASTAGITYTAVELNPETVARERARGVPLYYGDATQESVLETLRVRDARVAVIAISDPEATVRAVAAIRRLNPVLHLIVRTRYVTEVEPLLKAGASEVIPEEFETSIEIFNRVLARYLVPREVARRIEEETRARAYEVLRSLASPGTALSDLRQILPDVEIDSLKVEAGCEVEGWTLGDLDLRRVHAVTLLAIRRGDEVLANPAAGDTIHAGDILVLMGRPERIYSVSSLFRAVAAT